MKPRTLAQKSLWLRVSGAGDVASVAPPHWITENRRALKEYLLVRPDEHWDVWSEWYDAVLAGKPPYGKLSVRARESLEVSIALIPEADWEKGAAHVNKLIKDMIAKAQAEERARKAKGNVLEPSPQAIPRRPAEPLPGEAPATQFEVVAGKVDVVPTLAWAGQEARADAYRTRALKLTVRLSGRLAQTNGLGDLKDALGALGDLLPLPFDEIQPDLLRLEARAVIAQARAMAHPQSEWVTSDAGAVGNLLELADALTSLQTFIVDEMRQNEEAIRRLHLNAEKARSAKRDLDRVDEVIAASPDVVSERTDATFEDARLVSDTVTDDSERPGVEGQRMLQLQNAVRAVVQELERTKGAPPPSVIVSNSPNATIVVGGSLSGGPAEPAKSAPRKRRATSRRSSPRKRDQAVVDELKAEAVKVAKKWGAKKLRELLDKGFDSLPALGMALYVAGSNLVGYAGHEIQLLYSWLAYRLMAADHASTENEEMAADNKDGDVSDEPDMDV